MIIAYKKRKTFFFQKNAKQYASLQMYRIRNIDIIKLIIFIIITDATASFLDVAADSHFAKTSLYDKAEQVLREKNLLILTGHSGEGKTAMAANLALEGGTKKENCIKLESVRDWENVDWSLRCFTTVIIDDIFGGIALDHERLREWKTVLNDVKQRATNKELRVVITSRRYIKEEAKDEMDKITMFQDTSGYIVHLDSRDLSSDEMKRILSTVLKRNGIDETDVDLNTCVAKAKGEHKLRSDEREECVFGFPECCVLFATETFIHHGSDFFKNPELHVKSYIEQLYKPNETEQFYKFITLVAVWAKKKHTLKETDLQNPQTVSSHIQNIAHCFGITINHEFVEIVKFALSTYTKFLVLYKHDSGEYTFSHNVIAEMVGVVLGKYKPRECIKLCQHDFLMKRVKIDDAEKSDLQVLIPTRMYSELCEKFIKLLTRQDCSGEQQSNESLVSITSKNVNQRIDVDVSIFQHNSFGINSFKEYFTKSFVFKNLQFRPDDFKKCFSTPLILATRLGQLESIKCLVDDGADINLQDSDGKTALHYAASDEHSDVMKELLDNKADVNSRDKNGSTPLHYAAGNGHLIAVKTCLKYGADVNMVDNDNTTALHSASSHGHSDVMKELLDNKAVIDARDKHLKTPLHCAAVNGHLNAVKTCLSYGADVKRMDNYIQTALHLAADGGHSDVMKELLDSKADVNARDRFGKTPLHCAARNGYLLAVKTCLSYGADVNMVDNFNQTTLHLAASCGHSDVVKELLDSKADVNARGTYGETPLHWAAENGHLIAVKTCLSYGADVNMVNKYNLTALHRAAYGGHSDVMKVLLDNKADVNVRGNHGKTPLQWAAENGHLSAVKTCLSYDADVNMVDNYNQTALHHVASRGHSDVMTELLENKADVNARDKHGDTPLHCAADSGHLIAVKTCLKYGADVNMSDNGNRTAVYLATRHGHNDIVEELIVKLR